MQLDRPSTRSLASLLLVWGLLIVASAALPLLGPSTDRACRGAVNPWLPFLLFQGLALLPGVACWALALRRRLDLPRGLFLLAQLPVAWGLLVGAAFGVLVYLAS
jgi:hypothetical protein